MQVLLREIDPRTIKRLGCREDTRIHPVDKSGAGNNRDEAYRLVFSVFLPEVPPDSIRFC
jgi:hypothetical protein